MTDDLETLRQAVEAFGRRKNDLSDAGKVALDNVTFNLGIYAKARENFLETKDERVMEIVRRFIMDDLATIEADLSGKH